MKQLATIVLILATMPALAQIYVSPNYYMYVKGEVLFVKQDVNLQSSGNIYLRNEAQLVQGTTGGSANKGPGKLSLYQEGTSDNYEFNYWCSPVGNASNTVGNENFGITMLGRPVNNISSTPASMLTTDSDGFANPLTISTYWIYKYLPTVSSSWITAGSASTIGPGEGFTMKGTSGSDTNIVEGNGIQNNPGSAQRYDFSGKPNDGNISVAVDTGKFTLTGNPYPSALHVNAFLLDASNTACTGIAYYWEQDKTLNTHNIGQYRGGYGTYSPVSLGSSGIYVSATFNTYNPDGSLNTTGTSSGQTYPRKYAPVGQGFMIQGNSNGTVTLKNTHRTYYKESGSLSDFERMALAVQDSTALQPVSHFKLNIMLENGSSRQLALAFIPEATDGVDWGIDAPLAADLPDDAYFLINDNPYAIEGIDFNINKRVKVGVKSSALSAIKFYIPEIYNFDPEQPVYIYDALDQSYHDIRNDFYEANLTAGVSAERFEVTFASTNLGIKNQDTDNFLITQDNKSHVLRIANPEMIPYDAVNLYDISGRLIINTSGTGAAYFILSTEGLSDGIYIVKILNSRQAVQTQKIMVTSSVQ
ncbi:T9SS type A sorting domain-containing protein [Flavobacterium pallidum]|uniref:Secretion protein n=1 Tax=Flavobacterium pallidum TaxID=2172098 RepID=A0A2S1SGT9_9FLAO|nr:T9SS type A sorting domain-containing protein [Flavobacterium pallidum]AWI25624.1 secretion protein [Flavobacterium pallidum]